MNCEFCLKGGLETSPHGNRFGALIVSSIDCILAERLLHQYYLSIGDQSPTSSWKIIPYNDSKFYGRDRQKLLSRITA